MKTKGPKQDSQSQLWSQMSLVRLQRGCKPCGYVNLIYWAGETDPSEAAILTHESFKGYTVRLSCYFFLLLFNCSVNNVCINIITPYPQCNCVRVFTSIGLDRGFESRSGQTKDTCAIDLCCFSANHAVLRRKSKDRLARHDDNVSVWSGMSTRKFTEATVCVKTCRSTRTHPSSESTPE